MSLYLEGEIDSEHSLEYMNNHFVYKINGAFKTSDEVIQRKS